jgi:hypothetical protein
MPTQLMKTSARRLSSSRTRAIVWCSRGGTHTSAEPHQSSDRPGCAGIRLGHCMGRHDALYVPVHRVSHSLALDAGLRRYTEAEDLYTASIGRWGRDAAPYTNRALCRIRLADAAVAAGGRKSGSDGSAGADEERARLLRLARDDCDAALRLDARCVRAYERRGNRCGGWLQARPEATRESQYAPARAETLRSTPTDDGPGHRDSRR